MGPRDRTPAGHGLALAVMVVAALSVAACAVAGADWSSSSATPAPIAPARATPTSPTTSAASAPAATNAAGLPIVVVELGDHWYGPAEVTVPVGTTVLWKMVGSQEHDVWARDGSFHSPLMGPGQSHSYTFATIGRYPYFCVPHYGDGMYGEVIVVPRAGG